MAQQRVVVIGGGISGLATGRALRRAADADPSGLAVTVLESEPRPGGKVRTRKEDGWTVECGPNGFLDSVPRTLELAREVGLEERVRPASDAAGNRFLYCRGALRPIPLSPVSFLRSNLLSVRGRLRMLLEPFAGKSPDPDTDQSVATFARRHLGDEAAQTLVAAMVLGVFGGDAEKLSLRSAFPKMHAMETEYGSLFRAMVSKGRERRKARKEGRLEPGHRAGGPSGPGGVLTSFDGGMTELIEALASDLEGSLRCSTRVVALHGHTGATSPEGDAAWKIVTESSSTGSDELRADAVILACESFAAARLVEPWDRDLAGELADIPYAPIVVVGLGFDRKQIPGSVDGFGFLAPRGHGMRIMGCLWDSSIFPGRAPDDKVLLRAMIGGAVDPAAAELSDEEVVQVVREDLERSLGIATEPERVFITRWNQGIPQYVIGHDERLDRIDARRRAHPGLFFTGNAYRGVALNSCVTEADRMAAEVREFLRRSR